MTGPSGINGGGGYRPTSAPAAAPKAASSEPTVDVDAERAKLKTLMTTIEGAPKEELTPEIRASYANAVGTDKLYESAAYLGYLGKGAADSLSKKMDADVAKFMKENPNASLEDIKKHVTDRFKARIGEATVGKFAFDQALKMHQEQMERMKDVFEF